MKSATSSLHHLLSQHEDVHLPSQETHFFSMDDLVQHPDFLKAKGEHTIPDYNRDFRQNLKWYTDFFAPAQDDQLIGDYSSLYLCSPEAPHRISALLPGVKLIFMLRNPVNRTYSHYFHRVKTGRAVFSFENELQNGPSTLHIRSFYKPQLKRYLDLFSRDQIKIIIFERFVSNTQEVLDEVCSFLGLSSSLDVEESNPHRNKSPTFRSHSLQLLLNYLTFGLENPYEDHLPNTELSFSNWFIKGVLHRIRKLNLGAGSRPPMKESVRRRLEDLYARKNHGLGDLIGINLSQYWPRIE